MNVWHWLTDLISPAKPTKQPGESCILPPDLPCVGSPVRVLSRNELCDHLLVQPNLAFSASIRVFTLEYSLYSVGDYTSVLSGHARFDRREPLAAIGRAKGVIYMRYSYTPMQEATCVAITVFDRRLGMSVSILLWDSNYRTLFEPSPACQFNTISFHHPQSFT